MTDLSQLRSLLERLTRHFNGDRELADPTTALVGIPLTRNDNVYPNRLVRIDNASRWRQLDRTSRRWTLGEIEHATESKGRR